MEQLEQYIHDLFDHQISRIVISNPVKGVEERRITVRPVSIREQALFQAERLTLKQAFHDNLDRDGAVDYVIRAMERFRQLDAWTEDRQYSLKISKKGKLLKHQSPLKEALSVDLGHNRSKNYLLPEGKPIPPLVDLGVFTPEGYIVKSKHDKYRQIHRFVEVINDGIKDVNPEDTLNIVDFGCGKSYLTFILYYFLTEIRHLKVNVVGLDLKEDVIHHCNQIALKYGYDHLTFQVGDISVYQSEAPVDMVISLHACDTATDYALFHAINWKAKRIYSVPCCQHEVDHQLTNQMLPSITDYGILKERMAALITDGTRADLLKAMGYQVQVMEFVDMIHSPKNLLIRAHYTGHKNKTAAEHVKKLTQEFDIEPTLYHLLKEEL